MISRTVSSVHFNELERNLILGLLRARDYPRLIEVADSFATEVSEGHVARYMARSQFVALIKKYPFTREESAIDPRSVAIRSFMSAEQRCKRMNTIFRLRRTGVLPNAKRSSNAKRRHVFILGDMRRVIRKILGESPNLDRIYELCDFTSGAAIGVHGNRTNLGRKVGASSYSVSPGCRPYAEVALWKHYQYRNFISELDNPTRDLHRAKVGAMFRSVPYNKVSFVPKTAKTERSIAVEPLLNGYLQKGVDLDMRRRLLRIGIDLSDQSRNQELARLGSIPGSSDPWCTIDLSMASDSLCREVVRYLLPSDWFEFLDSIRSHSFELDGRITPYEKFVSMGNGFCFPLQTLIFASACIASIAKTSSTDPVGARCPYGGVDFLVYGDDIIVRKSSYQLVCQVLHTIGFKLNTKKSFSEGPFRESCGADWMNGRAVRPVYLKDICASNEAKMAFHNSLRNGDSSFLFVEEDLASIRDLVEPWWRLLTPFSGRSGAFEVPLDLFMSCKHAKWNRRQQCWSWSEILQVPVADNGHPIPPSRWEVLEYVALLRRAGSNQRGVAPLSVRRKTRARVRRVSSWGDPIRLLGRT
jgi:hypothetical protein